jgi:hypothetical protein
MRDEGRMKGPEYSPFTLVEVSRSSVAAVGVGLECSQR